MRQRWVPFLFMAWWSLAGPAVGGTLYVPLNTQTQIGDIRFETHLLVTNKGGQVRRFNVFSIPQNTDGTVRMEGDPNPSTGVSADRTIVVVPQTEAGTTLLEVTSAPQLVFRGELVSLDGNGGVLHRTEIPLLTDRTLVEAGETIYLQGLERGGEDRVTHFGLINLSAQVAQCTISVFRADGGQIAGTVVLSRLPLSLSLFEDVLGILQEVQGTNARLQVSCDQPFYAYGVRLNGTTGAVSFITPSASGASELVRPGSEPPCPEGGFCFEFPGLIFAPTSSQLRFPINIPFEPGLVFRRIEVKLDVFFSGYDRIKPDGIHNFFWMARNRFAGNTFGFVTARGGNRNNIIMETNAGLPSDQLHSIRFRLPLVPGTTYHLDYFYDTRLNLIRLQMFDKATGGMVAELTDVPTVSSIVTEGFGFFISFGGQRIELEVPTIGWKYSDLEWNFLP